MVIEHSVEQSNKTYAVVKIHGNIGRWYPAWPEVYIRPRKESVIFCIFGDLNRIRKPTCDNNICAQKSTVNQTHVVIHFSSHLCDIKHTFDGRLETQQRCT